MIAVLAATAAEPDAGWGKLLGLLAGGLVFWLITAAAERWQKPLPPTDDPVALGGAKPQVTGPAGTDLAPVGEGSPAGDGDLDRYVMGQVGKTRTMQIVNDVQRRFKVSRRTALRAVGRARGGQS